VWADLPDPKPFLINIDHHISNTRFGQINWVDPSAASTAEMVLHIVDQLGVPLTQAIAACLLYGLSGDTMGFRTSNTNPSALRLCAMLMETGSNMPDLYMRSLVHKSFPAARYWGAGLSRLEQENGIVWGTLTLDDRKRAGYGGNDDADLINLISAINGNKVGMIFVEQSDNHVKISWRALEEGIDVSPIAIQFGGGGHAAAAGADVPGTLSDIQPLVLKATKEGLGL
jgi:phosphoesterase RecJ-like protein